MSRTDEGSQIDQTNLTSFGAVSEHDSTCRYPGDVHDQETPVPPATEAVSAEIAAFGLCLQSIHLILSMCR